MMNNNGFLISKEECHSKAEKVMNEYEQLLQSISSSEQENIQKTIKLFTQIDSLSKTTENSIEKSTKILDQVFDKKLTILSTVKSLNEIQQSLDLNTVVKQHWHPST